MIHHHHHHHHHHHLVYYKNLRSVPSIFKITLYHLASAPNS